MAIVKLVCQGCGANLDALDNQRVLQCGYCGTTNQIKQTVHERPVAPPPPSPLPSYAPPTPVPSYGPAPVHGQQFQPAQANVRRGVGMFVAITAILPLLIGGVVAYLAIGKTSEILDQVNAGFGGGAGAPADARKFRWESGKPFVADVDGDGSDDLIGLIQPIGAQDIRLTAVSGEDWTSLWELSLGDRATMPGQPQLYFDPGAKLALFPRGAALTAYEAASGEQRWVSNLSDAVASIVVDGELLRVTTIDNKTTLLGVADGKPTGTETPASEAAVVLRDDHGYELIPELRNLDLDYDQFADLRIDQAFCPESHLPVVVGRRNRDEDKVCSFAHGLAWASRAEGTKVPFMVGYEPATKAERWRIQLTAPGSLATVETGFSQPRAELFDDTAILGFQPSGGLVTLRRISLVDGSTTWESTIDPEVGGEQLMGMIPSDDRLYVHYRSAIYVFDLATGQQQAKLGGW